MSAAVDELAGLPDALTADHKLFWNKYTGEEFRSRIGPRGKKKENARTYTRGLFVKEFCDKFFPSLSPAIRQKFERNGLGLKAYSFLTNNTTRNTEFKPKTEAVVLRVYAHDVWRKENPELFKEALRAYESANPDTELTVGMRRSINVQAFKKISPDDKEKYKTMASEQLTTIRALHELSGEDRMLYVDNFMKQLHAMFKEGDVRAGIKANAQVLHIDDSGNYHITTIVTQSMGDLEDAPEIDRVVQRMKEWVKDTAGKNAEANTGPTVYPDYNQDMYPLIPVVTGLKVVELQKILRQQFTMLWMWHGGSGKVPWELIGGDLDSWIPAHRRPAGAILGDPNSLRLGTVGAWVEYFQDCQVGKIPLERRVQFSKVFAGPSPIDPSLSQETSRQPQILPQHNKETWVLEFTDTVTRCHAPGGMEYPDTSVEYAKSLRRSEVVAAAAALAARTLVPSEFLNLPTGSTFPSTVIDGQEKALIFKLAGSLKEADRVLVTEMVNAINELQAHNPATTESGIWAGQYANSMPAIFPASPEVLIEGLLFIINFWLPIGYYTPSKVAELRARFPYLRMFFEDMLTSSLLRHEPSQTIIGGLNGSVWLVRALILLIFNYGTINGDLRPPSDPPSPDYDVSALTHEDLTHVLGWSRHLVEILRASTATLAMTSEARRSYVIEHPQDPVAVPYQSAADFPAAESLVQPLADPSTVTDAPTQALSSATANSTAQKRRATKAKKGLPDASAEVDLDNHSMSTRVSDKTGPELDFDKLDPPASNAPSSEELDPNDYSYNLRPNSPPPGPLGHFAQLNNEDHIDEGVSSDGFLYWLQDKFGEIFSSDRSNSSDSGHVFGPFPPLPPASQMSLPNSYEALYANIEISAKQVEGALRGWVMLSESDTACLDDDARAAQQAALHTSPALRPLVEFAVTRKRAWERAKILAPSIFRFTATLVPVARTAIQIDTAVGDFLDAEDRAATVGDAERDALSKLHRRLLKVTVQLCWLYNEIHAFEKMSTDWSNRLPDNWLCDTLPTNGRVLYALISPLVDWARAAQELDHNLRAERKATWPPIGRPFEARHRKSIWYWFGNPRPNEIPGELEACLKEIEEFIGGALDDISGSGNRASPEAPQVPLHRPSTVARTSPSTGRPNAQAGTEPAPAVALANIGSKVDAPAATIVAAAEVPSANANSAGGTLTQTATPVVQAAPANTALVEAAATETNSTNAVPAKTTPAGRVATRATTNTPSTNAAPAPKPVVPAPRKTRAATATAAAAASSSKSTNHVSSTTRNTASSGNAGRGGKRGRGRKA